MNEKTDPRALRGQIVYSESSNKLNTGRGLWRQNHRSWICRFACTCTTLCFSWIRYEHETITGEEFMERLHGYRNYVQNQNSMEMHMISLGCLEETARRLWLIVYIQMKMRSGG